jgi:hypothetical protein
MFQGDRGTWQPRGRHLTTRPCMCVYECVPALTRRSMTFPLPSFTMELPPRIWDASRAQYWTKAAQSPCVCQCVCACVDTRLPRPRFTK